MYFAGKWPQKCLNTHIRAWHTHTHTDARTRAHTHTPVNVPQSACSSRWRDSAAFSSRTAEEPFLSEEQDDKGGVVKVNKLYKMELWKDLKAPAPGGFDRAVIEKKEGKHEETATTQSNSLLLLPGYHSPGKERLLCVIGRCEGHAHTNTPWQTHTHTHINADSIWSSLPVLQRGLESLAQIYWRRLRFCHWQVNVVNKEINVSLDLTSFVCIENIH